MSDPDQAPLERIQAITEQLHDALRELGYDHKFAQAVGALPDARDRLQYVVAVTGRAAERTMDNIEQAKPIQDSFTDRARELRACWDRVDRGVCSPCPDIIGQTRDFLRSVEEGSLQTGQHLMEILEAQNFHDLAGQVISKIQVLASNLENQLLVLLRDSARVAAPFAEPGELQGPVIKPQARTDVVSDQQQVDDLMANLGF